MPPRVRQELLAVPENADWVAAALPSWQLESATIHTLPTSILSTRYRPALSVS